MQHVIHASGLLVEVDEGRQTLTISDREKCERLIVVPNLNLCLPELGHTSSLTIQEITSGDETIRMKFTGVSCDVNVILQRLGDILTISSIISIHIDCELTRLSIFPQETALNLYDIVNFRNRHYTPQAWPELLLGGSGCETDTYSGDWQFAPHPSMMILRKNDDNLCLGVLDMPTSYGLYFKASDFHVRHCYLNYGTPGHGQKLAAGSLFHAPRIGVFLDKNRSAFETTQRYTKTIVDLGLIPDPANKIRYSWHRQPLYCTWMDQGYISGITIPDELAEQQLTSSTATAEACTESLVRQALEFMEKNRLCFKTILLDEGWEKSRGDWEADPIRFPNLRALVDDIHARNMKVIVWWNWAELFDDVYVNPAHLAGAGWINPHGLRMRDYSNPATQKEYLEPLFHKLFSSDKGCYDLDGVKTDFLADKVHFDMPLHDPTWRGEENYCFHLFRLFYSLMRRHKPDACHIGCAGHPYLAAYIDINRTYDVATSNVVEHLNRAKMLESLTPGCPVAFDFHNFLERFDDYFRVAKEHGASVQIGNILGMKRDGLTPWEPANEEFIAIIRHWIS